MPDDNQTISEQPTAEDVARYVKRKVTELVNGKQRTKEVAVQPSEILSFKDYGTHVVAVTKDGQKLSSAE